MRHALLLALLPLALTAPALAQDAAAPANAPIRLICNANDPGLLPQPLAFSIDLITHQASETTSGGRYGVTEYRDGLGLWEADSGPGALVYRIDRISGRFARVDKQIRLDGQCERAERKF